MRIRKNENRCDTIVRSAQYELRNKRRTKRFLQRQKNAKKAQREDYFFNAQNADRACQCLSNGKGSSKACDAPECAAKAEAPDSQREPRVADVGEQGR